MLAWMQKREHLLIDGGGTNLCSHYRNPCGCSTGNWDLLQYPTNTTALSHISKGTPYPTIGIPAHPYSLLLYSQQPEIGNNLDAHQLMNCVNLHNRILFSYVARRGLPRTKIITQELNYLKHFLAHQLQLLIG